MNISESTVFIKEIDLFSVIVEDKLIDDNMKKMKMTKEQKLEKCHGILKLIEPCAHVLEVNFPLLRDNGK